MTPFDRDAVPVVHRAHDRWLLWGYDAQGKKPASSVARPGVGVNPNDPQHWRTFEEACAAVDRDVIQGIGFALGLNGDGTCFSGIDLDDVRDPSTGAIEAWARDVISRFQSYTEVSPSGTGIKIFITGQLAVERPKQGKVYKVEVYDRNRYFTVTGQHLPGTPTTVEDRTKQLRQLYDLVYGTDLRKKLAVFVGAEQDGDKLYIPCPWQSEHTTPNGPKDAVVFFDPAGQPKGFKCLHAHCANRHLKDVLAYFHCDTRDVEGDRRLKLTRASDIQPAALDWLWASRLPLGKFALLAGREGIGKTTFAYTLIAAITRGALDGECKGTPRTVFVSATEDSWDVTIVPRLMAAGADLTRVFHVEVETPNGVTELILPKDIEAVEEAIRQEEAALFFLDPLMSRLHRKLDTHKDADVRVALEPLGQLAHRTNATVLGVIHVNKGGTKDPLNAVMGSRAFTATARCVLFVAEDPEDEGSRIVAVPKLNDGDTNLPSLTFTVESVHVATTDRGREITAGKLVWTGETDRSIRDVMAEASGGRTSTVVDDAAEWLRSFLERQGGVVESQAAKVAGAAVGHSESTLKRAAKKLDLRIETTKTFPRRTYWMFEGRTLSLCHLSESGDVQEPTGRETKVDVGQPAPKRRKGKPDDAVRTYLQDNGRAPASEVGHAVGVTEEKAREVLTRLVKDGKARVQDMDGVRFNNWVYEWVAGPI